MDLVYPDRYGVSNPEPRAPRAWAAAYPLEIIASLKLSVYNADSAAHTQRGNLFARRTLKPPLEPS